MYGQVNKLLKRIEIRCSEREKNRIKWLAGKYCNGNVSQYLIYAALHIPPEEIDIRKLKNFREIKKAQ